MLLSSGRRISPSSTSATKLIRSIPLSNTITTSGAFYGVGRTITPSAIGTIFTGLRVPIAILLFKPELLGINGVWWSISGSSIVKGILLVVLFFFMVIKPLKNKVLCSQVQSV